MHGVKGPLGWSWHQQAPEITDQRYIEALDFYDTRHGWALGSDDTVLYTGTGGVTWQVYELPDSLSGPWAGLSGVQMTGMDSGYAVGSNTTDEAVVVSLDYSYLTGLTTQVVYSSGEPGGWFSDLAVFLDGNAFVVGALRTGWYTWYGVVVRTNDNWDTTWSHEIGDELWELDAASTDSLCVLGQGDVGEFDEGPYLYCSQNGGASWQAADVPTDVLELHECI